MTAIDDEVQTIFGIGTVVGFGQDQHEYATIEVKFDNSNVSFWFRSSQIRSI